MRRSFNSPILAGMIDHRSSAISCRAASCPFAKIPWVMGEPRWDGTRPRVFPLDEETGLMAIAEAAEAAIRTSHRPPGPANGPFGIRHLFANRFFPLWFARRLGSYGDYLVRFRAFGQIVYLVNHPDTVHEILARQAKSFRKVERYTWTVELALGAGVLTTEGDLWRKQRHRAQPAFQPRHVGRWAEASMRRVNEMLSRWHDCQTIDVEHEMARLPLEVSADAMLGSDLGDRSEPLVQALKDATASIAREARVTFQLPDWLPVPHRIRRWQVQRMLHQFIQDAFERRRATPVAERPEDLLTLMVEATEGDDSESVSTEEAYSEALSLFTAGFHAASSALTWTSYLLAEHREIQQRVHDEAVSVAEGHELNYEDLGQLEFTQRVIKESLRLYPPAWQLFTRRNTTDVTVAGYEIPAGAWFVFFPLILHRDARFFPDPLRFDPDRFLPERSDEMNVGAYMPFGYGPHACLGRQAAMTELTLAVAAIVRDWSLELLPDQESPVLQDVVAIRPRDGLRLLVRRR